MVKYICDLRHWSQLVSIEEDCNLSRLGAPPDSHQSSRIGQRLSDLTARERGERRGERERERALVSEMESDRRHYCYHFTSQFYSRPVH